MKNNIKVFKLKNGLNIVAKQEVCFSLTKVALKFPCELHVSMQEEGSVITWVPYFPFTAGCMYLDKSEIVGEANPTEDIIDEFNKLFR